MNNLAMLRTRADSRRNLAETEARRGAAQGQLADLRRQYSDVRAEEEPSLIGYPRSEGFQVGTTRHLLGRPGQSRQLGVCQPWEGSGLSWVMAA